MIGQNGPGLTHSIKTDWNSFTLYRPWGQRCMNQLQWAPPQYLVCSQCPQPIFRFVPQLGSTTLLSLLNRILIHSKYSRPGHSYSSDDSQKWPCTCQWFAGCVEKSSVISAKITRNCVGATIAQCAECEWLHYFRRTNSLAVPGHCWSTHTEAVLLQHGAILVNILCLAQFGSRNCVFIKMAQLAQQSHPWICTFKGS